MQCSRRGKRSWAAAAFSYLLIMQLHLAGAARVSTAMSRSLLQDGSAGGLTLLTPFPAEFEPPDGTYTVVSSVSEMLAAVDAEGTQMEDGTSVKYVRVSKDVKSLEVNLLLSYKEGESLVIDCQGALLYWGGDDFGVNNATAAFEPNTSAHMFHCIIFGPPSVQQTTETVRYSDCRVIFPCGEEVRACASATLHLVFATRVCKTSPLNVSRMPQHSTQRCHYSGCL